MGRLTQYTPSGASLILDNPQSVEEARQQVMEKFKIACNRLFAYEQTGLTPKQIKTQQKEQEKCHHDFSRDLTAELSNFLTKYNGHKGRSDRGFYMQLFDDGDMQINEFDDSGGGHEFSVMIANYCPICGKKLKESEGEDEDGQ